MLYAYNIAGFEPIPLPQYWYIFIYVYIGMVLKAFQCFYFSFMCHPARERALSHASFVPGARSDTEGLWEWKAHTKQTSRIFLLSLALGIYFCTCGISFQLHSTICIRKAKIVSAFLLPCCRFHLGSYVYMWICCFIYILFVMHIVNKQATDTLYIRTY